MSESIKKIRMVRHVTTLDEKLQFSRTLDVILKAKGKKHRLQQNKLINDPFPDQSETGNAAVPLTYRVITDSHQTHLPTRNLGAFMSDASAINLLWLKRFSPLEYHQLMGRLFGADTILPSNSDTTGVGLSLLKLPIGACDMGMPGEQFTLADTVPFNLPPVGHQLYPDKRRPFAMSTIRWEKYLFPVLRDALQIQPNLNFVLSSWSAPAWMKTTQLLGGGTLRADMITWYATYLADAVKMFETKLNASGSVCGIIIQHRPEYATDAHPSMLLSCEQEVQVAKLLRARLDARGLTHTRILAHDYYWDRADRACEVFALDQEHNIDGAFFRCDDACDDATQRQEWFHQRHPDRAIYLMLCRRSQANSDFSKSLRWYWDKLYRDGMHHRTKYIFFGELALDQYHGPCNGGSRDWCGLVTIEVDGQMSEERATTPISENRLEETQHPGRIHYEAVWYCLAHIARYLPQEARPIHVDVERINPHAPHSNWYYTRHRWATLLLKSKQTATTHSCQCSDITEDKDNSILLDCSSSSSSSDISMISTTIQQPSVLYQCQCVQATCQIGRFSGQMLLMNLHQTQPIGCNIIIDDWSAMLRLLPNSLTTLAWPLPDIVMEQSFTGSRGTLSKQNARQKYKNAVRKLLTVLQAKKKHVVRPNDHDDYANI